jgi:hypothetical protein
MINSLLAWPLFSIFHEHGSQIATASMENGVVSSAIESMPRK